MEVSDNVILRAVCQIDYDHTLRLLSEIGNTAQEIIEKYEFDEHQVSGPVYSLSLRNSKLKRWAFVGSSRTRVVWNTPGSFLNFQTPAEQICARVLGALKQPRLRRIGVRLVFLFPIDGLSFEELHSRMLSTIFTTDFVTSLAHDDSPPSDTALVFDYLLKDRAAHLEIGAMRNYEAAQKYEEDETAVPKLGLLVDSDYFVAQSAGMQKLPTISHMLRESHEHSKRLALQVTELLGGQRNA